MEECLFKQKIIISVVSAYESSDITNGNIIQLSLVAFLENATVLENESWIIDSIDLCFNDQNKIKDPNVIVYWQRNIDIRNRIANNAKNISEQMVILDNWIISLSQNYYIKNFISNYPYIHYSWFKSLYKNDLKCHCISLIDIFKTLNMIGFSSNHIKEIVKSENFNKSPYALDSAKNVAFEFLAITEFLKKNLF